MLEAFISEALPTETREVGKILAVGSPSEWQRQASDRSRNQKVVFVAFSDIDGELLDLVKPDAVVSPALAWNFDCIDLAVLLEQLRFMGAYRATAMELPKPELIEREISQLCPKLDFAIINTY